MAQIAGISDGVLSYIKAMRNTLVIMADEIYEFDAVYTICFTKIEFTGDQVYLNQPMLQLY